MSRFELQSALKQLPTAFNDAILLNTAVIESLAQLVQRRIAEGKSGSGRPQAPHRALNRAVVVAAVGGMEAYFESLAQVALNAHASAGANHPPQLAGWFTIVGSRGVIQTPSPENIRKLYWALFHVDLMPYWAISVGTSAKDQGEDGTWRSAHNLVHKGEDAVDFLNAMVQVRHSFAHMEVKKHSAPGMALRRKDGTVSVQSHHAFNAVSAAIQISIQSTIGLANHLGLSGAPRWESAFQVGSMPISYWLKGSELWTDIERSWLGKFQEQEDLILSTEHDILVQENPSLLERP